MYMRDTTIDNDKLMQEQRYCVWCDTVSSTCTAVIESPAIGELCPLLSYQNAEPW